MSMRYPGGLIATSPVNARYPSGVWTQAQAIPYQSQNVWTRDQFWPNTTLLLQGDGAVNGAQNNTFLDSSSNNFAITRNGNTTQGSFTPYEPMGYWSNYFDGSTAWLTASASSSLALSGNFTVEFWLYYTGTATNLTPGILTDSGTGAISTFELNNGSTYLQIAGISATNTVNRTTLTGGAIGPNQWYHLAFVRNSNVITAYINGVAVSTTMTNSVTTGQLVQVGNGRSASPSVSFLGYLSNYRIVSSAVYTSNFTPPAAPLTAITGTQLLTCQDNRFRDNSSNALTFTVNGSPSVQAFQPFPGATTWSASVLGGSGYFDGSGDFLTFPTSQTPLLLGNSDFTAEAWVYRQSGTGTATVLCGQSDLNSASGSSYVFYVSSSGNSDLYSGGTSFGITSPNAPVGAWSHVAWVRTGGTYSSYLNGVRVGTRSDLGTSSVNNGSTANAPSIGAFANGGNALNGYISNLRLIKGSGGYDATQSTITIPTVPVTAIANTSLLTNFTNAGIYDNSMMNNLETVGNAQVSTSVVKYGTGSMAFDGTGDYLSIPDSEAWNYGSGNFTIEFWANFNVFPSSTWAVITSQHVDTNNRVSVFFGNNASNENGLVFKVVTGGTTYKAVENDNASISMSSLGYSTGVWYHVAIVRNGNSIIGYVNGVQRCTLTTSASFPNLAASQLIGVFSTAADFPFNGYIDDLRITKGAARYIGNFTPPPARLPAQ